jgi:hypothetical protein
VVLGVELLQVAGVEKIHVFSNSLSFRTK